MTGFVTRTGIAPRAFSLLELFAALACGAVVLTAAMGTIGTLRTAAVASSTRAQLDRDIGVVISMLERDLQFLGAGIPDGACQDQGCTGLDLLPILRVATSDSLVFLGDQPYPNAELNGSSAVVFGGHSSSPVDPDDDHVVVSSEVSGNCVPHATGAAAAFTCSTSAATLVPGVYGAGDNCRESQPNARTCPWGMGKLQGATTRSHLVLATETGDWFRRMWDGAFEGAGESDPYLSLHFVHNPDEPSVEVSENNRFVFLSQPDRVFWSFEDNSGAACGAPPCRVMRNQCWGDMSAPDAGGFPVEGTGSIRSTTAPSACAAGTSGTGWEQIASNVKAFSLSYFQNPTTPLAAPVAIGSLANVRLVQLDMTLSRTLPASGQVIDRSVRHLFFLQNRERDAP